MSQSKLDALTQALLRLKKLLIEHGAVEVISLDDPVGDQAAEAKLKSVKLKLAGLQRIDCLGGLQIEKIDALPRVVSVQKDDDFLDKDLVKKYFGLPKKKDAKENRGKAAVSTISIGKPKLPASGSTSSTANVVQSAKPKPISFTEVKDKRANEESAVKKRKESTDGSQKNKGGATKAKKVPIIDLIDSDEEGVDISVQKVSNTRVHPQNKRKAACLDDSIIFEGSITTKPSTAKPRIIDKSKKSLKLTDATRKDVGQSHTSALAGGGAKIASVVVKPPTSKILKVCASRGSTAKPKFVKTTAASVATKKTTAGVKSAVFRIPKFPEEPVTKRLSSVKSAAKSNRNQSVAINLLKKSSSKLKPVDPAEQKQKLLTMAKKISATIGAGARNSNAASCAGSASVAASQAQSSSSFAFAKPQLPQATSSAIVVRQPAAVASAPKPPPLAAAAGAEQQWKKQRTAESSYASSIEVVPQILRTKLHTWITMVADWHRVVLCSLKPQWSRFPKVLMARVDETTKAFDIITLFGYGQPGTEFETDIFMCHTVKMTKVCQQNGTLQLPVSSGYEPPRFKDRNRCRPYLPPGYSGDRSGNFRDLERRRLAKEQTHWSEQEKRRLLARRSNCIDYGHFESSYSNQHEQERRLLANNVLHLLRFGRDLHFGDTPNLDSDISRGFLTQRPRGIKPTVFEEWFAKRMSERRRSADKVKDPEQPLGKRLVMTQHGNTEASIAHLLRYKEEFNMKRDDDGYYDDGYHDDAGPSGYGPPPFHPQQQLPPPHNYHMANMMHQHPHQFGPPLPFVVPPPPPPHQYPSGRY